jgi:hypothetical protein
MGDGTTFGLLGPYTSGEQTWFPHTYRKSGTFTIQAKATDAHGAEGNWSDPFIITIAGPSHNVSIKGGFGLTIDVINIGAFDATNVTLHVGFNGGFIIRPKGGQVNASTERLIPQQHLTEKIGIIGFGKSTLTIEVSADGMQPVQKQVTIRVFGIFIKIL